MYKRLLFIAIALMILGFCAIVMAEEPTAQQPVAEQQVALPQQSAEQEGLPKEKVLEIATVAVKEKGMSLDDVSIVYDDGNKLWAEEIGVMIMPDDSPNHGVMKRGFLKNYRTVFFDFKEPIKDVWVFIDKDTGEIFEVYQEQ